jgi:hypothetical protein
MRVRVTNANTWGPRFGILKGPLDPVATGRLAKLDAIGRLS